MTTETFGNPIDTWYEWVTFVEIIVVGFWAFSWAWRSFYKKDIDVDLSSYIDFAEYLDKNIEEFHCMNVTEVLSVIETGHISRFDAIERITNIRVEEYEEA